MKYLLAPLILSFTTVVQAADVVPLLEFRTMWGVRIQLSNDEGWCHRPQKAAMMYDGTNRTDGCWKVDSSGEVISIEWPTQTTDHPRRRFVTLGV